MIFSFEIRSKNIWNKFLIHFCYLIKGTKKQSFGFDKYYEMRKMPKMPREIN